MDEGWYICLYMVLYDPDLLRANIGVGSGSRSVSQTHPQWNLIHTLNIQSWVGGAVESYTG